MHLKAESRLFLVLPLQFDHGFQNLPRFLPQLLHADHDVLGDDGSFGFEPVQMNIYDTLRDAATISDFVVLFCRVADVSEIVPQRVQRFVAKVPETDRMQSGAFTQRSTS